MGNYLKVRIIVNNWILFVSWRHLKSKRKEKGDTSTFLSIIGILSGVMTMITVIGVMNGFQGNNIDKRVEIESGHIVLEKNNSLASVSDNYFNNIAKIKSHYLSSDFITAASDGIDSEVIGLRINSLPDNILEIDSSFKDWVIIKSGDFDLTDDNSIVIGQSFAFSRYLQVGDSINLISLQNGESNFKPELVEYRITGIFYTGSLEYDEGLAFISNKSAEINFVKKDDFFYKLKIENRNRYLDVINILNENADIKRDFNIKSWKDFNVSYYNALKNEKDLMTILIGLIFLVVGVNIYNSQRRAVYLRLEEISVLKTMGATSFNIKFVYILESLFIGIIGATVGVLWGLWIVNNINFIFDVLEDIMNFLFSLINGTTVSLYGSQFFYISKVPVKVYLSESIYVYLSAVFTSVIAAFAASRKISLIKPGEVIRNE